MFWKRNKHKVFFYPPSSETTKSLYKDDSNSLLSFAGPFSFFFPSSFCRSRKIVRNSSVKESITRVVMVNHLFRSCSCSSFFPLSLPNRLFKSPLPYTSLKLKLASLSFAPRCRTRSKLQKNISFKTNRPLWNNLARKAENLNQADKKWRQETYPFATNLLHEKDTLWAKSLFFYHSGRNLRPHGF